MKVGILTFHNAYNYGAVLQTFATQELVKSMGHDTEVIDYHNKAVDAFYERRNLHWRTLPKRNVVRLITFLVSACFNKRRQLAYRDFQSRHLHVSRGHYIQGSRPDLSHYDAILIGSDQLWNKNITNGFDDVYWGDFTAGPRTVRIAWSVCMNNLNLQAEELQYVKTHLKNFEMVSVREKPLQSLLSQLSQRQVFHTIDPTLMLPSQQWLSMCHEVREHDYIAVYAVRNEEQTVAFARETANRLNKKLVIIRSHSKHYISKENKEHGGPVEFLSYIRHADMVVTSSFHGTVFSMIFRKQFVVHDFDENVRVADLLERFGLTERMVASSRDAAVLPPIDYQNAAATLRQMRHDTQDFLERALREGGR